MFKLLAILFIEKRKYALICVSPFHEVSSAWMCNTEIMPKMAIILIAIND